MSEAKQKTLGQAIDEVVAALEALDAPARETAIRAACDHLGLAVPESSGGGIPGPAADRSPELPASSQTPQRPGAIHDIRTLRATKSPRTVQEMACLVAYYLESLAPANERKQTVTIADLEKYFKQAGHKLPKRIEQVLIDGKASGYFDSVGRGKYKLNPVGHNLVVHSLPRTKA